MTAFIENISNHFPPLYFVLALLGMAIALFIQNKLRMDTVALLVMLGFGLSGILTTEEIFAGLGDPNIVLLALYYWGRLGTYGRGKYDQRLADEGSRCKRDQAIGAVNAFNWLAWIFYELNRHCRDLHSCSASDLFWNEHFATSFDDATQYGRFD